MSKWEIITNLKSGVFVPSDYVQDLVRCKDCIYGELDKEAEMYLCRAVSFPHWNKGEYFCADGERKDQ